MACEWRCYDVSLRSVADEIKRKAGHQRYSGHRCGVQNGNVVRRNNASLTHGIFIGMSRPDQFNDVTRGYTLQTTEKAIPVSCDP